MKEHPASIAKFHASCIIQSALDSGWEAPQKYSPLKRSRIENRLQQVANRLLRQSGRYPKVKEAK